MKKQMKTRILFVLIWLILWSLTACGQKGKEVNSPKQEESETKPSEVEDLVEISLPAEDTYWVAYEWHTDLEDGTEDVLVLPSQEWALDLVFCADGTARFRDVQGDFYLLDDSSLFLKWEQGGDGIIWFYTDNYLEPFCCGVLEKDIFALEYMGSDLLLKQYPMPQDTGKKFLPAELVGTWLMVSGETEGWEWEATPGQMESLVFKTAWTAEAPTLVADSESLNHNGDLEEVFYEQELTLLDEPLYEGCDNESWSVRIGPVSERDENGCPKDTEYYVTLLDCDRLLLQRYFALDGAPMVTYQTFWRIPPSLTWWELEEAELSGTYWECAGFLDSNGMKSSLPPGFDDFYLFLDVESVCWLGRLQTGDENYTDTEGSWLLGDGGTILIQGEGYEGPEGYCPEFWHAGAVRSYLIETEDGFSEHYDMYLYYNGGLIYLVQKESFG